MKTFPIHIPSQGIKAAKRFEQGGFIVSTSPEAGEYLSL
jgi:hypothetical protein